MKCRLERVVDEERGRLHSLTARLNPVQSLNSQFPFETGGEWIMCGGRNERVAGVSLFQSIYRFLYSCLRAKNGHLFWNSDHQPIKGIVFELFERVCGKVPLAGDLRIDNRIGDL